MKYRTVLDVYTVAYLDAVDIAAQYCAKPYAAVAAHHYIAYDGGIVGQVAVFSYLGSESPN